MNKTLEDVGNYGNMDTEKIIESQADENEKHHECVLRAVGFR